MTRLLPVLFVLGATSGSFLSAAVPSTQNAPSLPAFWFRVRRKVPESSYAPPSRGPSYPSPPVAILKQSQENNFDGTFSYSFESEDGIALQAKGYSKTISPTEQAEVMEGQYSYTAPDGTPIVTRWYADETGFHAEGNHLPVAAPLSKAIPKSAYKASQQSSFPTSSFRR